jgi:exodeoxyribonuclease V alpha subunit
VVKVLALLLEQQPRSHIALAAPTGKAAARLSAAIRDGKQTLNAASTVTALIPEEATTLHRLLGGGRGGRFRHDHTNPLVVDCVVVDEASMIDLPLMARLLDALPPQCRLILLGDRDQLASVDAGNVLGDITGHGSELSYSPEMETLLCQLDAVPAGSLHVDDSTAAISNSIGLLQHSYRFADDSGIGKVARQVNAGHGMAAFETLCQESHPDLAWLSTDSDELNPTCLHQAVDQFTAYLMQNDIAEALRGFDQFRVLAALRQGPFGVEDINRRIARRLQQRGLIDTGPGEPDNSDEYHGKPVIVTVNDYEVGLFNGDTGLLWKGPDGKLSAWFLLGENELRAVPVRQLPQHSCAYALTVHKSQGSEFDQVLLVLPAGESPVVTRELIYTGITRARRHVTVQACRETFIGACQRRVQRSSALAEKLGW